MAPYIMIITYVFSNIVPKILGLYTISLIIERLSNNDYVSFDFVLATSGICFPILSVCLADGYYHFYLKTREKDYLNDASSVSNLIHLFFLFVVIGLLIFSTISELWIPILILSWLQSKIYLNKIDSRVKNNNRSYILSDLLPSVIVLLGVYLLPDKYILNSSYIYIYLFAWIVSSYILSDYNYFSLRIRLKPELFKFSIPLVPNAILVLITFNLFRYVPSDASIVLEYALNYRVVMFYVVLNSVLFLISQDLMYKYKLSLMKFIILSFVSTAVSYVIVYLCADLIIPYYLGNKLDFLDLEVYFLSVMAMVIAMVASSASIILNFNNKPIHTLVSNVLGVILSLIYVYTNYPIKSDFVFVNAMIISFVVSLAYRVIVIFQMYSFNKRRVYLESSN